MRKKVLMNKRKMPGGNKGGSDGGAVGDVMRALALENAEQIRWLSDEEILAVKGVGPVTLGEIREMYPMNEPGAGEQEEPKVPDEPEEPKVPERVRVRVLPYRGVGGIGNEGAEGWVSPEYARELVDDGYVELV
jgi:hypothetical protein